MIKVLHVFNQFNQGGIEHVVINLMENMDQSQIEFHFALMSGKNGLLDDKVRKLGGKIHYFSSGKKSLKNVEKNLSNIIEENGPFEVVHSHVYFFSGYILYIANKCGVPVRIAHAHDTYKGEKESIKRQVYEYLIRKAINRYATYKFGVSKDTCLHVFGKIDKNTHIINNGVNLENYKFNLKERKRIREELNISENECLLCNIGRFEDQKDHNFLIDVFSNLIKVNPKYKLLLVGNGSLKQFIVKKVKKQHLENRVVFLENRNDVNKLLFASDIFALPSKYEGLPVVLIEAQATGIPCIISDTVTNEVKLNKNVYSVDKGSTINWVNAIEKHKSDKRLKKPSEKFIHNFDIKEIAKFVQKIYTSNFR